MTDNWNEIENLPTYVKYGRHIYIGGDPKRKRLGGMKWDLKGYQKAVLNVLKKLDANKVGQIILNAIDKDVMIAPRNIGHWYGAQVFATTGRYYYDPNYKKDRGDLIVITKGAEVKGLRKGLKTSAGTGTGVGANAVEIDFIPATFIQGTKLNSKNRAVFTPEGALLHEMVHAVRMHRGQLDTRVFKGYQSVYQDKEEFLSVLVANLYRSTIGAGTDGLRWKYDFNDEKAMTMKDIGGQPYDEYSFFDTFKPLMAAIYLEIPKLFGNLAGVDCSFNPVKVALKEFRGMTSQQVSKLAKSSETYYTVRELLPDWHPNK